MKLIPLTQGKFAQIDDEDFEELNKHKWYAKKDKNTFYATRNKYVNEKQTLVYMHRIIINTHKGQLCDHIDGNGLNNQKTNLRIATKRENGRNRIHANSNNKLKIKGIHWDKENKKFRAVIRTNNKPVYLGRFFCLEKAKRARQEAEPKHFGEFAPIPITRKHEHINNN